MTPDEMRLYLMDKGATKPAIPKHERKANLDKFLQPSVEKGVMYHATLADFNQFRNNPRGMHFVTPDLSFANNHLHGQQDRDDPLDSGENIMPVHVQVTNPFDYAKLSHVKNLLRQAKKQKSTLSMGQKRGVLGGNWSILEHPDIVKAVKRLGHDAMYVSEDNENNEEGLDSKNLGVFDPRKIKSAIGNRGTYDTREPDITKADGGAINKRDRKANLAKFMSDSKIKKRLYHATTKDFKEFKPGGLDPNVSGHAIWLSADPRRQPAAHNLSSRSGAPREGHNVMPVHVQAKNPMVLDNKGMLEWAQAAYAKGSKEFPELMPKEWADAVQEDYDSIIHADPHGSGDPHEIIMFHPNKIKSAIGNRGTYDVNEHDMSKAEGGAINAEPLGEDTVKWTSPLADTVNSHKLGSMSGEQWMSWLHANAPRNAKKEAHASGTFDWLPQQANASKEAIVKHMKANAPRIKVKKFSDNPHPKEQARYDELHNDGEVRRLTSDERDEMNELEQKLVAGAPTRFDEYQLPRGENYREMTLSHSNHTGDDYIAPAGHGYQDNDADINRILHMRMNDMPYAFNDKKALNIEELQSDWAQRGRSSGFKKPVPQETYDRMYALENKPVDQMSDTERAQLHDIRSLISSKKSKGLPSGPYVTETEDWTRLGLHNAIKEAAEKGHHAVTWTNGDEQAKRWNEEGLKHYYDTVMPSVANDILKRMGVKERVGKHFLGKHTTGIKTHHGFHMTPEIVAHIKKHGLPRFATGGRSVEALDRESDEVPIEKRVRDALDKIHLNASGGKDAYGTGAGGRLAVDFPLSKNLTLSPYLEGSAYKPNNQNTSSQISGAGLSLTKRFAEGGKAKFLEPSAEKGRWYHGTNRNIRKFKDANRVHFVSQSPDTANQFAMREHSNGEWGDPIKLDDKEYMEYIGTRSGANVMPVHIQVKNPFDIGKPEHFKAINEHMAKKYASHPEIHENRKSELARAHQSAKDIKDLSYSTFGELEHPHTQRAIKDMGHDSFYTNELGTRNLGIYDPRKIKSAIGNRGTYDTNEHDITKSKGGLAHAFAEGGPVDIPKNILDLHAKDQQLFLDNAVNGHANRHLKLRYTNSWKRLNKAIKAHIGDDPKEVLEYHWKLQDHYNKEHGE